MGNANSWEKAGLEVAEELKEWPELPSRAMRRVAGSDEEQNLRVFHWNMLADGLSGANPEKGGFVMAPPGSLDWEKRRWRLLEEILRFKADVLTLCEVDHHADFFAPRLAELGFRSIFAKKPCSPCLSFGSLEDGCALFWKDERLEMLASHCFEFVIEGGDGGSGSSGSGGSGSGGSGSGGSGSGGSGSGGSKKQIQNQVAIVALLRFRDDSESCFVVATTHLKAEKTAAGEVIRAKQVRQLLAQVEAFREAATVAMAAAASSGRSEQGASDDPATASAAAVPVPVIVTGDFNAVPGVSADGYAGLCFAEVEKHPMGLKSAYPLDTTYTTWKVRPAKNGVEGELAESKHCIDYVLLAGAEAVCVAEMPDARALGNARAPSFIYPSDHFSLAVDCRIPSMRNRK